MSFIQARSDVHRNSLGQKIKDAARSSALPPNNYLSESQTENLNGIFRLADWRF
jgi:hypothetical protein